MPWRRTRNPYHILVSEVMLQQTQVLRVIVKYKEFLKAFPTVKRLAEAAPAEVIRAWKGLGYNRRALFLQKTARTIRREHGGRFPKTYKELIALPGVGDYTARAILSFAFDNPVAMMDTNHRRFYQRVFFGLKKKRDQYLLVKGDKIVSSFSKNKKNNIVSRAYIWNQALMDFGSQICTTQKPGCHVCPIQKHCKAFPRILTQKHIQVKKKSIPFKETDRYVRGRIIDALRQKNNMKIVVLEKKFPDVDPNRFQRILSRLAYDGLISLKKDRILLPT